MKSKEKISFCDPKKLNQKGWGLGMGRKEKRKKLEETFQEKFSSSMKLK